MPALRIAFLLKLTQILILSTQGHIMNSTEDAPGTQHPYFIITYLNGAEHQCFVNAKSHDCFCVQ